MRKLCCLCCVGIALTACNSTSSSNEWREVETSRKEERLHLARTICQGRAGETQVLAGRLWIMGAMAADSSFKACMAQQGFVQN